jgi:hypothetical protein
MKKLTHFATALAKNTLSISAMTFVKGGSKAQGNEEECPQIAQAQDDEKRRERPGGGISTN